MPPGIHRSNLIGMGIPPLPLPAGADPQSLRLQPGNRIEVDARPEALAPRAAAAAALQRHGIQGAGVAPAEAV